MEILKVLPLDLDGNMSSNYIIEEQPVTAKTRDWYRPDYAPFYEHDFEMYDGEGMLLRKGVHYVFETMSDELLMKSGKPVRYFVRILKTSLNNKGKFKFKYRSVGNTGFPRSLIAKMVDELINSDYWVDWDTQVLGKPATFAAYQHWHDAATEVANWDQFILFSNQMLNIIEHVKRDHFDRNQQSINSTHAGYVGRHKAYLDRLLDHDYNHNNPHRLTREDFPLDFIPNAPLATVSEDLRASDPSMFTTPKGLDLSIELKRSVERTAMANGENRIGGFSGVHPYCAIGRFRSYDNSKLGFAGYDSLADGTVEFFTGDGSNLDITSVASTPTSAGFTGFEANCRDNNPVVFKRTMSTLGGGVVVVSDDMSQGRYYPESIEFRMSAYSTSFVALDFSEMHSEVGYGWEDRTWVIAAGHDLIFITLDESRPLSRFKVMKVSWSNLGPYPEYSPRPFMLKREGMNALLEDEHYELDFFDLVTGAQWGTYKTHHHTFTRDVPDANSDTSNITFLAAIDKNSPERINVKLMSGFLSRGKYYPMEMSWLINTKERTMLRVVSGSNARLIDNNVDHDPIDPGLAELTKKRVHQTVTGCYAHDGSVVQYHGGRVITRAKLPFDHNEQSILKQRITDNIRPQDVLVQDATPEVEILPTTPEREFVIALQNSTEIVIEGTRVKVEPYMMNIKDNIPDYDPRRNYIMYITLMWEPNGGRVLPVLGDHTHYGIGVGRVNVGPEGIGDIEYDYGYY